MAPIVSSSAPTSEFAVAPHALKSYSTDSACDTQPETEPTPLPQCQVCFDDIQQDDGAPVEKFCGAACPALLCQHCLSEHVRVAVEAAIPGVLPKVRCPICLVPVNKSKWTHVATMDLQVAYALACQKACSFQSPCCHNVDYTQLPIAFDDPDVRSNYRQPDTLQLVPSLKAQLEPLRKLARRFGNHRLSSKALMLFVEDTFGSRVPIETQHLIMEHLLARIMDEERRATLLLSYHAKYKMIKTRCCDYGVCFNCKRLTSSHTGSDSDQCEQGDLAASCIVECRSCHVTIVKVEGCDSVRCLCGFSMNWEWEVGLRDRHRKRALPVDLYDLELCSQWSDWQTTLYYHLQHELFPIMEGRRRSLIDQLLVATTVRKPLRRALQQYVWRRRFARGLPQLEKEIRNARLRLMAMQMEKSEWLMEPLRRWIWRTRWNKVVAAVRSNQFWLGYYSENREELVELKEEEMELLMPGMVEP